MRMGRGHSITIILGHEGHTHVTGPLPPSSIRVSLQPDKRRNPAIPADGFGRIRSLTVVLSALNPIVA
jgi:hypothetical protein